MKMLEDQLARQQTTTEELRQSLRTAQHDLATANERADTREQAVKDLETKVCVSYSFHFFS